MENATTDEFRWNLLQLRAHEQRILQVFDVFRSNGIEPILFKGWAAARYYPDLTKRRPGDIDIAVSRDSFDQAQQLTSSDLLRSAMIDLHCEFRHLDTVEWSDLFEKSEMVELHRTFVRVPSREDHLRILATHWLNDGGRFKEKLFDIYYAVESRPSTFDWRRGLEMVGPYRRGWTVCAISLAHRYLGLGIEDLPFADELKRIPSWITRCIEREWKRADVLEPILTSTYDRKLLLRQIMRRLPPNPIRATIEANGDLYGHRRCLYQAAVLGRRAGPLLRGSVSAIRHTLDRRAI